MNTPERITYICWPLSWACLVWARKTRVYHAHDGRRTREVTLLADKMGRGEEEEGMGSILRVSFRSEANMEKRDQMLNRKRSKLWE